MELNFFGVARVTKAVLPAMRAARSGRIITVTSLNGVIALPFSDAYNAAKFAVEGRSPLRSSWTRLITAARP